MAFTVVLIAQFHHYLAEFLFAQSLDRLRVAIFYIPLKSHKR